MTDPAPVLTVNGLTTLFGSEEAPVRAVDGVSLELQAGEILGLVGESGSGKSVTGFSILGLVDRPGRIVAGEVQFRGTDLRRLGEAGLQAIRGRRISMVFQDPMSSLCPTLKVGEQMVGAIRAHRPIGRREARELSLEMLRKLDIPAPELRFAAYPHQLSGGMRQRICIGIALINEPDVLIADEPTTALDVTTQAQILFEVRKLCTRIGTSVIWISHDLAVVSTLADRVAVMYAGQIVEQGAVDTVLANPLHPYTRALLDAIPNANRGARRLPQLAEAMGLPSQREGCRFRPRCPRGDAACAALPELARMEDRHEVRCFHPFRGERVA